MKLKLLIAILAFFNLSMCYSIDLSKHRLSNKQLFLIYESELDWMRNEIFARKGYVFTNKKYQDYFSSFSWYTPQSDNSKIELSDTETYNANLLKERAQRIHIAKAKIKDFLQKLEKGEVYKIDFGKPEAIKFLKVDAINFTGLRGQYGYSVDDGYSSQSYIIIINLDGAYFNIIVYDNLSPQYPRENRFSAGIDEEGAEREYLGGEKSTNEYVFEFDADWNFKMKNDE